MRIGIDCRSYGPANGYMGKYLAEFISYLVKNEDGNEYVLFFHDRELSEFTVHSPRFRTIKTSARLGSLSEQILFPYELSKEKLDIMLFSAPNTPVLYYGKTIVIIPDLVSYFYPMKHLKGSWMRNWSNFILRRSLQKASAIIAFSETLRRDIIEIFDIHEDQISIIPPMFLDTLSEKVQTPWEIQQALALENIHGKYMLIAWELREYKNIPRFLQAYSQLLWEGLIDMDLVLIGKEDSGYHDIRSELIELGLQGRVHIYNVLDESKRVFFQKNASLYVLPSLYEGSEQTILEALFYKIPILSSLLPSITAILPKSEATFLRPMSVPDIKQALQTSLWAPVMGSNKRDMSEYSISNVSAKIAYVLTLQKANK